MSVEEFRFNTFADSRPINIQKNICSVKNAHLTYSPSYNLTPPICGVWLVNTWFFAHWHHQPAVTCPENVRHLNIRRGKKLGFHLSHRQPSKISKMTMFSRISRDDWCFNCWKGGKNGHMTNLDFPHLNMLLAIYSVKWSMIST